MKLRALSALLAGLGVSVLAPRDASAFELGTPAQEHPHRSAQNFYLELKGSPYSPRVDSEPALNGRTPFKDAFGDKPRFAFSLEFDWQLYRIPWLGTIGPAFGFTYVTMSRDALTKTTKQPSADTYGLDIYPLELMAVLRADTLWLNYGIPFVPYAKAGMAYAPWRATNALGTSDSGGAKGKGATLGTNVAFGMQFAFGVFDRGAARALDNVTGINNTYIFAEYYWLDLNGVAQDTVLYVGTHSWAAGLAFEF